MKDCWKVSNSQESDAEKSTISDRSNTSRDSKYLIVVDREKTWIFNDRPSKIPNLWWTTSESVLNNGLIQHFFPWFKNKMKPKIDF